MIASIFIGKEAVKALGMQEDRWIVLTNLEVLMSAGLDNVWLKSFLIDIVNIKTDNFYMIIRFDERMIFMFRKNKDFTGAPWKFSFKIGDDVSGVVDEIRGIVEEPKKAKNVA